MSNTSETPFRSSFIYDSFEKTPSCHSIALVALPGGRRIFRLVWWPKGVQPGFGSLLCVVVQKNRKLEPRFVAVGCARKAGRESPPLF